MTKSKIALLLSYICIASISATIITPAFPKIQTVYHLSSESLEWVMSIFLIGYVVGQLIYAPIANRYGTLNALRTGLIVNFVGILICLLASTFLMNYSLLLFGRLISALGSASGLVCTFILINELLPPEEAKAAMAYSVISFTVGIGLFITIGSLLTQYASWVDCFWVLLLQAIILFWCTWCFKENEQPKIPINLRTIFSRYVKAFSSGRLVIFALMAGVVSVYSYGYSTTASLYSEINLHLSPSEYGYWSLSNTLGMLAGGFLSAQLIKKIGVQNTLFTGLMCMIPFLGSLFLISITHHGNVIWFFTTTMFLFVFTGLLFPTASYFASNAIDDRASASSAMSFINMGLATLSTVVLGYLPFSSLLSFVIVLCVLFAVVSVLALRQI
ncbi:MAG TPA: MFS transporter [Coxiellaceae bacterium]|nr:MAG: MFS transporter [Gammaproteobacteria bacterium RIFCSPHIGHO2_12_FULL_36_30]HLB56222.1 MFS transporter [Coxiellaceae bacterium]